MGRPDPLDSGEAKPEASHIVPFKPYIAPETKLAEFTAFPLILGTLLGMIFGASSLYLVLRVGLTVSASIPVAVISISIFALLSKLGLKNATILQNNIVQTAGSAGESIAFGIGVTMPAILILGFDLEVTRVILVALLGGLLGILMMIPLRRALIVQQHGILKYPEGTACAEVLKVSASDESRAASSAEAKAQWAKANEGKAEGAAPTGAKTIFTGFGIGLVYATLMKAFFAWKEYPAKVFGSPFKGGSMSVEVSPALLGVGYVIGPRIASIMCAGGVLAYLVLIPAIKFFGEGMTTILPPGDKLISKMGPDDIRSAYVLYIGAGAVAAGGIISLFRSLPTIWHGLKGGLRDLRGRGAGATALRTDEDLSMRVVLGGIIVLIATIMLLPQLHLQWNILGALLIVAFGFLFVTVSSRLTGEIGSTSNPISGMTVATLLLTCLIFLIVGWTAPSYYVTALSIGGIVCIAASNGGTTSQDLKTGYLVGSTPKFQQMAILVGALASALVLGPILLQLNKSATVYVPSTTLEPMISAEEPEKTVTLPEGATTRPYTGDVKPKTEANYRLFRMIKELEPGDYLVDDATGKIAFRLTGTASEKVSEAITKLDIGIKPADLPVYQGAPRPGDALTYRAFHYGATPPPDKLDDGDYLINEASQVAYAIQHNFPADLHTDVTQLTKTESIEGPQSETDARTYHVWINTDDAGGGARKYLVDDQGIAKYLVDPGINGTHKFRPDETQVSKYDAPKATLMSYIIKGILDRRLPWGLVLLGVMIAIVLEMSGIPSLAFAVGVYLPLSSSSPIFIGGMVRWLVDRSIRKKLQHKDLTEDELVAEGDKSPGVLMASGYIAGAALAGIVIAFMAGVLTKATGVLQRWAEANNPLFDSARHPKPYSDLLSLIPFVILIVILHAAGREWILANRAKRAKRIGS